MTIYFHIKIPPGPAFIRGALVRGCWFYSSFPLSSRGLCQNGVVILMGLELYQSPREVTDSLLSTQNRPNLMTLIWSLLEAQSLATTYSRRGC